MKLLGLIPLSQIGQIEKTLENTAPISPAPTKTSKMAGKVTCSDVKRGWQTSNQKANQIHQCLKTKDKQLEQYKDSKNLTDKPNKGK